MSEEARQALAAAVNAVDAVDVAPHYRQSTKPGDGCIRLDRIRYPNRFGGVVTWHVMVTLSQDIATAEKWLDEHVPALVEALSAESVVEAVMPQQLALDTGQTVPCVVIEATRETEE